MRYYKFRKIVSELLIFVFLFENIKVSATPNFFLSMAVLEEIRRNFAEGSILNQNCTPLCFPRDPKKQVYLTTGELTNLSEIDINEDDYREITVYNVPYMCSTNIVKTVNGEDRDESEFFQSIARLYADSRKKMIEVNKQLRKKEYSDLSEKVQNEIIDRSNFLCTNYRENRDANFRNDVRRVAALTHLSEDDALESCIATFIYQDLLNKYGDKAVKHASQKIVCGIGAGVSFAAGAGTSFACGGPFGIIVGAVAALALGIPTFVLHVKQSKEGKDAVELLKNEFVMQRQKNGAELINKIIGLFTDPTKESEIMNSNVFVTGVDTRRFPVNNFKDFQKYKGVENHGAYCQFMNLNLSGSPTVQQYGREKFQYLFNIFRHLCRNDISIHEIENFIEGIPIELRHLMSVSVDDIRRLLIRSGMSEESVNQMDNDELLRALSTGE